MLPENSSAPFDEASTAVSSVSDEGGKSDGPAIADSSLADLQSPGSQPAESELPASQPPESQPPGSRQVPNCANESKPIVLSVREKVAIELHNAPEPDSISARWVKVLKDAGPAVTALTALFSLIFSFLFLYAGHQINRRQTEINEKQTELKQRELEVAQADLRVKQAELSSKQSDLRQKVFAELNQPQETSQTLAAIRLAEYGEEILDPIRMALAGC